MVREEPFFMTKVPEGKSKKGLGNLLALGLGALGVVYGDIGTSPLYALKEIFFGREAVTVSTIHVLGVVSTVIWALTLIVTIKYVILVLRADHEAEGGVFALYARLRAVKIPHKAIFLLLLIFAAGLLFGDGVITPAISVISAVEGIGVAAPSMSLCVVPVTIAILTGLFAIQKQGTSKIGKIFGPVMFVWFVVLAIIGISNIMAYPQVLQALSPLYVWSFVQSVPWHELLIILGFVMLVVTGGEAMYADLGHFGRGPIRLSWLAVAYPALLLNYLGQGAYLLSGHAVTGGSIFYSMVPTLGLYPMIALSTLATIIASQALITGSYSLASQAVALDLLPAMPTKHTHHEHAGQIYIAFINIALYISCIALVLVFKNSSNLASAYGLAVSGVMLVTTITVAMLARYEWKWATWQALLVFVPFGLIDAVFLLANSLKFIEGGYVPLSIGVGLMVVMAAWRWGMGWVKKAAESSSHTTVRDLLKERFSSDTFLPKTVVIMTDELIASPNDPLPALNEVYLARYELMPEHLLYLTVAVNHEPIMKHHRLEVVPIDVDPAHGTIVAVQINYGFMEEIELKKALKSLQEMYPQAFHSNMDEWVFHVIHHKMFVTSGFRSLKRRIEYAIFRFLYKNSLSTEDFLGIDQTYHVTAEVVPVRMK
jgi:KUP system potassium uptake protein